MDTTRRRQQVDPQDARALLQSWVNGHHVAASGVIEALGALFPDQAPRLTDSIDAIRYHSGQASVAVFLRGLHDGD